MNSNDTFDKNSLSQVWSFTSIATFSCSKKNPIDAAQQGILDQNSLGTIDLKHLPQSSQMIDGLNGFSHLWLVFAFHQHSQQWKPKVWPPRSKSKVGVLASRSPYRPNPIGISVVELLQIKDSRITVKSHDLLDGTPILDIKPYIAYADSVPHAQMGWLKNCEEYLIIFSSLVQEQLYELKNQGADLEPIIKQQLRFSPTQKKKKRVRELNSEDALWVLSIRTWRVIWKLNKSNSEVLVDKIYSGYNAEELGNIGDPYHDKEIHRTFIKKYGSTF